MEHVESDDVEYEGLEEAEFDSTPGVVRVTLEPKQSASYATGSSGTMQGPRVNASRLVTVRVPQESPAYDIPLTYETICAVISAGVGAVVLPENVNVDEHKTVMFNVEDFNTITVQFYPDPEGA